VASPDVVVVGSGIAGLVAALAAAPAARVLVLAKGSAASGCTGLAQGGVAAAVGPGDSPELHAADTIAAGRGLCDERAVQVLTEEAPERVAELARWGVEWDRRDGAPDLHREGGHRLPRVLHAGGDATGSLIEGALLRRVRAAGIPVIEGWAATRLVVEGGVCTGVEICDPLSGALWRLAAGAVVLATGGASALWSHTTNPEGATGDGVALAFEAGADVSDMEFIQFHPTALAVGGAPAFLVSEAVRGEGGLLLDAEGRRFVLDADPRGELAPRDVVARAIALEMARSGRESVLLDCRALGRSFETRFPTIAAACRRHGLDPAVTPIPVSPAAHYTIGGVVTDLEGATTLPGLHACGEVARTGVHGANRLASNSLLEGLVFGRRAGRAAATASTTARPGVTREQRAPGSREPLAVAGCGPAAGPQATPLGSAGAPSLRDHATLVELRELMWSACGISRTGPELAEALARIDTIGEGSPESRSLHLARTSSRLVVEAALHREESRGAHHRGDFPTSIDRWRVSHVLRSQRGAQRDRDPATRH
jgi:L-aspartate oxidase